MARAVPTFALAAMGLVLAISCGLADAQAYDPFDPYPGVEPEIRERFEVVVLDGAGLCSSPWHFYDCPQILLEDGTILAVDLHNYAQTGTRHLIVERITFDPDTFPVMDASSIVYVAVGGVSR